MKPQRIPVAKATLKMKTKDGGSTRFGFKSHDKDKLIKIA